MCELKWISYGGNCALFLPSFWSIRPTSKSRCESCFLNYFIWYQLLLVLSTLVLSIIITREKLGCGHFVHSVSSSHTFFLQLKVKVPAPACLRTTKLLEECTFETAVSVELCGSFPIGQALSSTTTVDVRVVIPKVCYNNMWDCEVTVALTQWAQ